MGAQSVSGGAEIHAQVCLTQGLKLFSPGSSVVKNLPASSGVTGHSGSTPGSGSFPGGGNGNLFQYSCLENPMDRGTCGLQCMGSQRVLDMTERLSTARFLVSSASVRPILFLSFIVSIFA